MCLDVEIKNGAFSYGKRKVFENINLKINKGDIIAVVGKNGAGKTTLLKCLAGILDLTSGEIIRNDKETSVFVPALPTAYEYLTGYEYLLFIQSIANGNQGQHRIEELLRLYTLYDEKDKLIKDYSHGMKQKLSLCAALIHEDVDYILLDEPLTGVDKQSQVIIMDNFRRLAKQNKAIILATHQIETLKAVCNRIYYLETGEDEYL